MGVDYLSYYYAEGTPPFRCLTALPDAEAIRIMRSLYEDSPYGARFRDPAGYLRDRRRTEQWVREQFGRKGGKPVSSYPVPMALGSSPWLFEHGPRGARPAILRIPLSAFAEYDVSFTYPDSMISLWFGTEKPEGMYLPDLHGIVFTRSEILAIVAERGMPEESWKVNLPPDLAPYIEAQVWNHEPLEAYRLKTA